MPIKNGYGAAPFSNTRTINYFNKIQEAQVL